MSYNEKKYELSLWDDVIIDGISSEKKLCIIASDTMSSPAKAFNITLNKKTNGERTLNFSICAKYYDQGIQDYVVNPYLSLLTNERKVKLRKNEKGKVKWYDFIIKQVSEDSSNFTYTYTAKDQHIQELAKSGFELEFDKELQNNTGTKEELAREILKGTDWEVEDDERLLEYTKEPVYRGLIGSNSIKFVLVGEQEATPIDLAGKYVYITYYFVKEKGADIQILYSENDSDNIPRYSVTDDGVLDRKSYQIFKPADANIEYSQIFINSPTLCPGIRGERLVNSQKTVYDKVLEQYVKVYKNGEKEIYGFTRTEYNTPELVENLITNGEGDFISTDGWYNTTSANRELTFNPLVQNWTSEDIESFIKVIGTSGECCVVNTGLFDNRTKIPGFTAGQIYIFDCQLRDSSQTINKVLVSEYDYDEGRYFPKGEVLFEGNSRELTCNLTISAEQFKKKKYGIFIYLDSGAEIKSCQFYRDVKNSAGESILPGQVSTLEAEELVKTHYYYYNPNDTYTKFEDIKFLYEGYEEQTGKYPPVYNEDFEKRRSITGKESNRFNLLQEICEQFECWLKIEVNHDSMGKILPGSKKISFHEYVGKDNYVGFKYGINLKSIKRQIDSNQIVTKMITKDNSNEFAKNGFCSIARAPSNPSGTNVIYNFDYYIGQNLLGAEEVSEALYLTSQGESKDPQFPESLIDSDWKNLEDIIFPEGWGLFPKLDDITTKTQTITEEQIGISKNLTSLRASIDYEQARLDGAESSLVEVEEDLEKLTGYNYEYFLQNPNPQKYEEPETGELTDDQKKHNQFVDWATSSKVLEYKVKIRHLRKEVQEAKKKLQSQVAAQYVNGSPYNWVVTYNKDEKKLQLSIGQSNKHITAFQNLSGGVKEINGLSRFEWYITTYFGGTNTYEVSNAGSSPFIIVPEGEAVIVVSDEDILPELLEYSEENGSLQNSYQIFKNEYDLNTKKLEYYGTQRKKVEEEFYKKYSRFIQEGSWISEDYIDDELYYLDALAAGYTSSRPKVTYTIDVFDLAGVEDYENYEFEIGDKTFVQDQEFFGWVQEEIDDPITPGKKITIKRPYREEVVVNELTEGIDDITKNALKVQNYKTQFDDLFQRIAATTESLQYNTGRYERGAKAVEPDGSISHKALQQAVTENGLAIANAGAQTVAIDEQGVVTTDKTLPNKKVRIIGGGIYVTKDGGETWETGITGDGINANVITTGQLNTGEINIMTGDAASHRWDSKGITAYRTNYNPETGEILSISPNSFVRLDEFGLYGINSDQEFNARLGTTTTGDEKHGIAKIQRDSLFSLTQDGLTIGKKGYGLKATDSSITIGKKLEIFEDRIVIGEKRDEETGEVIKRGGFEASQDGLQIAGWSVNENSLAYNQSYNQDTGEYSNGTLFISPSGLLEKDISGEIDSTTGLVKNTGYTLYSNGNFGITTDGELHAQNAWIGGHIEADSGYIGDIFFDKGGINAETSEDIAEGNVVEQILPKIRDVKHSTLANTNNKTITITNWTNGTRTVHYYLAKESISIDITTYADSNGTIIAILSSLPEGESTYDCAELLYTRETESNNILIQKNQYLMVSSPVGKEATHVVTKGQNFSKNYNFSITSSGLITAQNAVIIGDIEASTLTANWGNIAGWKITPTALYYGEPGETNYFCLATPAAQSLPSGSSLFAARVTTVAETATNALTIGNQFSVKSNGTLKATGATIQGSVTITGALGAGTGSSIGGWSFDGNKFYQGENIFLSASGEEKDSIVENGAESTYTIWSKGNFGITKDGFIHAKNANIQGTIYATNGTFSGDISGSTGTIGQWTFGEQFGVKGFYSNEAESSDGFSQSTVIFSPKKGIGIYQGTAETGEGAYDWISWHKLVSLA